MDLLEFCFANVAEPHQIGWHEFLKHHHLIFDAIRGQVEFRAAINQILARSGIAFEMSEVGQMTRLLPIEIAAPLFAAVFNTGDAQLDDMLNEARAKFTNPDLRIRKEAVERLWDAFERTKTIIPGRDKRDSIGKLLSGAIPDAAIRQQVDAEMVSLTGIGNNFMIRHAEVGKAPINHSSDVDYLFQRMFSVMNLLLQGLPAARQQAGI